MTKIEASEAPTTPTDDPIQGDPPVAPRKKIPARGIRKRVLGAGEGDYCVYQIAPAGGDMPKGSLIPIPEIPRFESTVEAMKWIRQESGDMLAGKQIMVFRAMEILTIRVETRAAVSIETKPKVTVNDPTVD